MFEGSMDLSTIFMTVNTLRIILKAVAFGAGTILASFLALKRRRIRKEPSYHETHGRKFYCGTCKIEIPNDLEKMVRAGTHIWNTRV